MISDVVSGVMDHATEPDQCHLLFTDGGEATTNAAGLTYMINWAYEIEGR